MIGALFFRGGSPGEGIGGVTTSLRVPRCGNENAALPLSDLLLPFARLAAVGIDTPRPLGTLLVLRSGVCLPSREKDVVEEILIFRLLAPSAGDGAESNSGEGEEIGASLGDWL